MYRHVIRVRYAECDPQGIVFNARWGDWVDLAVTRFVGALAGDFDWRLVKQELVWAAPARFGDVVVLVPELLDVGRSSFTVRVSIRRFSDDGPLGAATTVYVAVRDGKPDPHPDNRRARLVGPAPVGIVDEAGVGGGRVVRVVREADRTTVPWRNGGGVTHEIVKEGDGPCGFTLRLSIADVREDGPFSAFPSVDRTIALLEGRGMVLSRPGIEVRLDQPDVPFSFPGEDAWQCARIEGPCRDLNLMVHRGRVAALVPRPPGRVAGSWIVAREAGRIGGSDVGRFDAVQLDGPADASVATWCVLEGAA